jgi:transposase
VCGGCLEKNGGQAAQALGRSRGGLSTQIHLIVEALGLPLDFVLTGGQTQEVTHAPTLLRGPRSEYVLADKSYEAATLFELMEAQAAIPVMPARSNRKQPHWPDRDLYKERHAVECFVNKIKQDRHIFSRFDKLASRYLSFLHLVSALIWLR